MADVCESHLERMGKELKCPICLSLLNSAVSLTCNHVFCNTCIEKSMKSASDCPVCKVPYRRREIRPAPHMDNLVSVYKSMEVASGVNIHATQNAVSTKILGEDNQTDNIYVAPSNGEAHLGNLEDENHKQCQRKGSKRASMTNQRPFVSNSVKPAFPAKKRIQVNPSSETQMQPGELDIRIGGIDRNQPEVDTVSQKNMSFIREKREHNFSPFFWLREEVDLEKSSQQTDGDQDMYTPPEGPCFSDIKESDDDVPCKISPKRGTDIVSNSLDFIDSEMFEWTQRPCSPELCSNSLAMQIEDTAEHHEAEQNGDAAMTQATKGLNISPKKREGMRKRIGKTSGNKCRVNLSNGEVSDAIETRQRQKTKKTLSEVTTVHVQPEKVTYQDMLENSSNKGNMLRRKRKNSRNNIFISESIIHEKAAENKSTLFDGTENLSNNNKTAFVDLSAPQGLKNSSKGSSMLKRSSNNTKRMNTRREKLGGKLKAGKCEAVNDHVNGEQGNEVLMSHSNNNMLPLGTDNEVSDRGMTSKTCEGNSKRMSNSLKNVKFYIEGMSKGDCGGFPTSDDAEATVTGQTFQRIQATKGQTGTKVPETKDKATPTLICTVLRKCKTLPSSIHCAFCQSSGESETSGVMVHYLEGKLVTDSDNARSNAVHVHKNCTEWAPNVYFDDEDVINLEDELSRSRRIGCSCCGKKGAALGCYEKSCRKSFHVPCARLTLGCRWDYENFVMLCPIHASCQLPNEITKSQCTQKRKRAAESKSHNHQVKATDESKSVSVSPWKSQKRLKNLVLCCSALTNTEKDIVFEFEKLSGVTIMKNWDSSVTHIIASTDENGACRRTLKFLMGVLEGKWILNVTWLKACMEAGELVDEQSYEIVVDIHGIRDGPRLGRLRLLHKQAKLFDGYTFFFMGDFAPSYKGYLHDLVIAAGGKILNRKPVGGDQAIASTTFIIYSLELPEKYTLSNANSLLNNRRVDAEAVASSTGSLVATNSWILNSIAGYKLQDCAE